MVADKIATSNAIVEKSKWPAKAAKNNSSSILSLCVFSTFNLVGKQEDRAGKQSHVWVWENV